ncbi:sensor histidine kinase [Curtobacterium sp. MCBA15_001]|uniref:sensor histidine kinase n=1 Tax=Curtobacterium sp. MCBA15_001 TaxID=1898731 RepID=UPI0008DD093C|nr:sensor histidine kinase [Curtobacterium sp. MCBA15_001]OIH95304.1 two-component sensor histidine kinase [Curtobacterium sp. MCBA15_001]
MPHTNPRHVFAGLRRGLHALVAVLLAVVVVRVLVVRSPSVWVALVVVVLFAVVYLLGGRVAGVDVARRRRTTTLWVSALSVLWVLLMVLVPDAAYLAFPLFFLYLHVLPRWTGPAAVVLAALVAVVALGVHSGFTVGGVVGPLVGAGVALLIGLGSRTLSRNAAEREAILAELLATQRELAATQHEQGALAERARLAREIHDTVAQGLSSIQMLLHAAEAVDADRPGIEHVRLARQTAAEGLADTRRFIRELSPPSLDQGIGAALRRLAGTRRPDGDLAVEVDVTGADDLPMQLQTAVLRIAQGALANVEQHAHAHRARLELSVGQDLVRLSVTDDGVGFDPQAVQDRSGTSDSFGLRAIAERVAQFGGTLDIDASPGRGTVLRVVLER